MIGRIRGIRGGAEYNGPRKRTRTLRATCFWLPAESRGTGRTQAAQMDFRSRPHAANRTVRRVQRTTKLFTNALEARNNPASRAPDSASDYPMGQATKEAMSS